MVQGGYLSVKKWLEYEEIISKLNKQPKQTPQKET